MFTLESHVEQKSMDTVLGAECPYCESNDCTIHSTISTAIGGDGNHYWEDTSCNNCGEKFVHEYRSGKEWYTIEGKVLKGIANCFEDYTYNHKNCGGPFKRFHTELDGITDTGSGLSYSNGKPQYRTFWTCKKCNFKVEAN